MKKKIIYSALMVIAMWQAKAQVVTIPDANFKAALISLQVDANQDGQIQVIEAMATSYLDLYSRSIQSLVGIESFANLTVLKCRHNNLTSINVSQNTALKELDCVGNKLLSIDISHNLLLEKFFCDGNKLSYLDASANKKLLWLFCSVNQITTIKLDSLPALTNLYVHTNRITSLDVKRLLSVIDISCGQNKLTQLDLSSNPALINVVIDQNPITSMDITHNPVLNLFEALQVPLNQVCVTPAQKQSVQFVIDATTKINENCFNVAKDLNFRDALIALGIDLNHDNSIDIKEAVLVDTLIVEGKNISSLSGIEEFRNLKYLNCSSNNLTSLRTQGNLELAFLDCSNNKITQLDLFPNTKLVKVFCHTNKLTSFKISKYKNTTLRTLIITNNLLSGTLNLRTSTYLDKLWCYNNPTLTSICVANTSKAQTSLDYRKDAAAFWTNNCGWVPREGSDFEDEVSESFTSLYPNPAKGKVMVKTNEQVAGIFVKSLDGILLLQSANTKEVDIISLSPGIYLVEIHTPFTTETKKLVVE